MPYREVQYEESVTIVEGNTVPDSYKENSVSEHIMGDAIVRIADIHKRLLAIETTLALLPDMKLMLATLSSAQSTMAQSAQSSAQSAQSMADTFKRSEDRFERMEKRHYELAELLAGKDQIPIKSHNRILASAILITLLIALLSVIGVLYVTKQDLSLSLKEIKVNQAKTQEQMQEAREGIEKKVDELDK